jgi:hypothetical protein
MFESSRFIDERLDVSITSLTPSSSPIDKTEPLTFQEWVKYNNSLFTNANDFLQRYQSYLNNWYETKNYQSIEQVDVTRSLYVSLIKEIVLTHTTTDERRWLKNIDFNNNRDLAVAIPFFAQKIKDICLYYSTLRDDVRTADLRYNLKGSNFGVSKLIYNEISKSLETEDLTDLIRTLNLSLSDIRNSMVIDIEDLYDNFNDYLDTSANLPASSYGLSPSDPAYKYFSLNQYSIDPNLFLDFNTAIVQAITSYPFYLIEFGDSFTITPQVDSTQLNFLKDSDFINTINTQTSDNLNLNNQAVLIEKFIGTDFYYVSTGATATSYVSGALFSAKNEFANYLNKRYPAVAAVQSQDFIQTAKEIGLFFKPDKIGFSNFTNFGLNAVINESSLSANTVYIFPDPSKYGNVSGLTKEEFNSPLIYNELNYFNKIDFSNQYRFGDSETNSYFQTFRGYQSREQTLDASVAGLARYTDPQEFFKGDVKSLWANNDVFPLLPQNVFPLDSRIEKLYSLNKTAVQYKNDVYGNEYTMYKDIHPPKVPANERTDNGNLKFFFCLSLDGHTFYDPISGYNFNYSIEDADLGYSGVTFRTANAIPPGSGYYTPAFNGYTWNPYGNPPPGSFIPFPEDYPPTITEYNSGAPSYTLSGKATPVASYRFQPETFCPGALETIYFCTTLDGVTFVSPGSGLLPDQSSDDPDFDPANADVYYGELIDGATNPTSILPDFRANFAYPGLFTSTVALSTYVPLNGNLFWVNSAAPCGDVTAFVVRYDEPSNFMNYHVPNRKTQVVEGLSGLSRRKTIYDARFVEYGDLYFRNANSSLYLPASSSLSRIYDKYSLEMQTELREKLIDFDLYYDTIQLETENYLIFDKIIFDNENNTIKTTTRNDCFFSKGDVKEFEKTSTVWFDEMNNNLFFCRTVLYYELSSTNYKAIYPEIYTVNMDKLTYTKLYPEKNKEDLTFEDIKDYSLLGKDINLNIVSIEKPIVTFDDETETYCISYLGKDLSNLFYIYKTFFKYVNGVITNISNNMFKLTTDVNSINFSYAPPFSGYSTYTIIGSAAGSVIGDAFIFGV